MIPHGWLPSRSQAMVLLLCAAAIAGVFLAAIPVLRRSAPPCPEDTGAGAQIAVSARVATPPAAIGTEPSRSAASGRGAAAPESPAIPEPATSDPDLHVRAPLRVMATVAEVDSSVMRHGSRAQIAVEASVVPPPDRPSAIDLGWYDELVVEIRAERQAATTVQAFWRDGTLLVPARDVFDLVEIRLTSGDEGEIRAVLEPEHVTVRIDPRSKRAWKGEREIPRDVAVLHEADGQLYIGAPLVEALLGVRTWFDLTSLTLLLDPVDHLPLGRRMARESARQALLASRQLPAPDQTFHRPTPGIGGATIDWSVGIPDHQAIDDTHFGLGLGASVLGGALNLSLNGTANGQSLPSQERLTGSWVAAWPENRVVRQVHAGTILGTGPRPRSVQGVAVGNSPFLRPLAFGQSELTGWLDPNWEVELYRNGELTDFARADDSGYYSLETEIDYGTNPVEVRAYGPNGEMRLISRALPVSADRLPVGRFEYECSAGTCPTNDRGCRAAFNLDLRYGVSRSWTARVGSELFGRRNADDLLHPYGVLSGSLGSHVSLRVEAFARALAGVEVSHEPSSNYRAQLSHQVFSTSVREPVLTQAGSLSRTWADLFYRPLAKKPTFFLSAHGTENRNRDGWQAQGRLQLTTQLRRVRWTLSWQEERAEYAAQSRATTTLGLSGSTALSVASLHFLHNLYVRGDLAMETRRGQLDRCTLALGKSIGNSVRLEAGASWLGSDGDARFMLGLSTNGASSRTHHRLVHTEEDGYQGSSFLDGSLVWNEAVGRLEPFPYQSSGRGGMSGWAFIDSNGNGWRDPGEEPVEGLQLRAGDKQAETDAEGRYSLWNMTPFEASPLQLVPGSLRNPLLVPQFNLASVHVGPNGFREVDVPLIPGTEVLGRVLTEDGVGQLAIGGLAITFRNVTTGRRFDATVFQDGEFYFTALPPGEYEVLLDEAALLRLGLQQTRASRHCVIPLSTGRSEAHSVTIDLVRAAKADGGVGWDRCRGEAGEGFARLLRGLPRPAELLAEDATMGPGIERLLRLAQGLPERFVDQGLIAAAGGVGTGSEFLERVAVYVDRDAGLASLP